MRKPQKIAIVGSSHVSWWEHAIATRQIPEPFDEITFIGRGAMPIWGDFIRQGVDGIADQADQVFLLLGDFRHGNRILTDKNYLRTGATSGNFLNIAKELISDDNDKELLRLIVQYLHELRDRFGGKLRILFWSLTFREFQSIENGRYGGRDNYRHPVWNLKDLVAEFADVAIDTGPLTRMPIHSLFLDASGHPTVKGHAFLYRLLAGQDAVSAYGSVCDDFKAFSHLLCPPDAKHFRLGFVGEGIAYKFLAKAVRHEYFQLPAAWEVGDLEVVGTSRKSYDRIVYLSGLQFQDEDSVHVIAKIAEEKQALQALAATGKLTIVFWDQWAREIVSQRPEYHGKFLPKAVEAYANRIEQAFAAYDVRRLSAIPFEDANGLVEFGDSFQPSGKGYAALFHLMVAENLFAQAMARYGEMISNCLARAAVTVSPATRPRPERLLGHFDGIGALGDLSGWAFDPEDPLYPVPVYLLIGDQTILRLAANQFYPGHPLADGCDGGFHGFFSGPLALSLLRNLRGGMSIRACFDAQGNYELPNSPLKLTQDALAELSLEALKPWQAQFYTPKYSSPDAGSLLISRKISVEDDPAIYPRAQVTLDNAIVENVKRLPPFLKAIIRARVIGGVYREDGTLEPAALGRSALGLFQLADKTISTQATRHLDTTCVYGGMLLNHYGHFIIEGLARFRAFQQFPNAPIIFTLPEAETTAAQELPGFMKAIFELLDIPLARIILLQETTSIKGLIIPKVGMRWFDYLDAWHQLAMAARVKASLGDNYPSSQHLKVYLSRSKLGTNHDGNIICGEAEFENYLREQGFLVIHPETLAVKEQVCIFCATSNMVGFVGSGFHTLLLCADAPEKIIYLNRKKNAVNPQFPLIDKVLGIAGEYLDKVIKNSERVSLVDFKAISETLMAEKLVQQPFDIEAYDFENEYRLISDWLSLKKKNQNLSAQDKESLAIIIDSCLNPVVKKEAQALLTLHRPALSRHKA